MATLDNIYRNADDIPYGVSFRHTETGKILVRVISFYDTDGNTYDFKGPAGDDEESVGMGSHERDPRWDYLRLDQLEEVLETQVATDDVYRPVLEERKVGKVQVHLVDQGFPNALMEVAKVMTWAESVKGYKPNDWKNLPDAANAFQGAATRHKLKRHIQQAEGLLAIDCVDEESSYVHLAHEAFNILAQLELVLTGKIK